MVDINNLNRIRGILSARLGSEIPKFQNPAGPINMVDNSEYIEFATLFYNNNKKAIKRINKLLNEGGDDPLLRRYYERSKQINPNGSVELLVSNVQNIPGLINTSDKIWLKFYVPAYTNAETSSTTSINTPTNTDSSIVTNTQENSSNTSVTSIPGATPSLSNPTTAIPGANPDLGNPNASVEDSAALNASAEQIQQQNAALTLALQAPIPVTLLPVAGVNGTTPELVLKIEVPDAIKSAGMKINTENAQKSLEKALKKEALGNFAGQASVAAMNMLDSTVGAQQAATDSNTTKTADAVYDGIAGAVENMGPVGKVVGTAMKYAGIAGDAIQSLGGGTDQLTKMDQWMDSSFFSWNIGMINGFAGKNTQDFGVDLDILASVGSSYGGTASDLNDAAEKAGKKYGLFSTKARKKADKAIADAKAKLNLMGDISDTASDQRLAVQSMGEQAGLAYSMMTGGGYDLKYTYAAKHGGLLEWNPVIELEWEPQIELNWELPEFKDGGNVFLIENLEKVKESKPNLEDILAYYKDYDLTKVNFIEDSQARTEGNNIYYSSDEDAVHELWHYISQNKPNEVYKDFYHNLNDETIVRLGGDLAFVKRVDGDPGHFYNPSELESRRKAAKDKTKEQAYTKEFFKELRSDENKYGYNMRDLLHMYNDENLEKIFNLKKGGSLGCADIPEIEETTLKNVIPEGALHKNKHHMEHAEGLTKKGIPVIDEDGELQAEIEHSEIIFTLEVTKKLEEYYEIFYSESASNKEKEQAALEAGKLLVYLILENTEDRTGLIESCKKGGTLNFKKSTEDLIEEALEWIPTITIIEQVIEEEKEEKKSKKKSEKELMKEAIKEVLIELLTK